MYLGCNLNADWDPSREVRSRIEQARVTFLRMQNVFESHSLSPEHGLENKNDKVLCIPCVIVWYGSVDNNRNIT